MATPYAMVSVDETTSTQDLARSLMGVHPMLVVANGQTEGRGRSGAAWQTAPSALATSLAFHLDWPSETMPRLTLAAGVAAARALGPNVALKWPNDLLVDGGKVGGILTEATGGMVVVGLGVNLHWPEAPDGMGAVFDSAPHQRSATGIAQHWVEDLLSMVAEGPESWPRQEYLDRSSTVGRAVTWQPAGIGRVVDIDETGAMVVNTEDGHVVLTSGAVTEVRLAP